MKPCNYKIITLIAFALGAALMNGCAMWSPRDSHRSTSVVEFLYPDKKPFVQPSVATLSLPMRVGVVFVPANATTGGRVAFAEQRLSEVSKDMLMRTVSDQFKKLPYVSGIEIIPTQYLRPGGSFENLDQLRSLLGIDVIALIAYDQQQNTTDTPWILSYWTIVGAYTVEAQKNNTATLMEAVVYDIASRKLLFRAAGTDVTRHRSTFVGTVDQLAKDSSTSFGNAAADLGKSLQAELVSFKTRIKDPAQSQDVKLVAKPGYNLAAGALGVGEAAALVVFAILVSAVSMAKWRARVMSLLLASRSHWSRVLIIAGLLGIMSGTSGCVSSMMLKAGNTERKLFGDAYAPLARAAVETQIGSPVETVELSELPSWEEFRSFADTFYATGGSTLNSCMSYMRLQSERTRSDATSVLPREGTYCRYNYKGRIISENRIRMHMDIDGFTWCLAEPILIPVAGWTLATGRNRQNFIDVWYDHSGLVAAYMCAPKPVNVVTLLRKK